MAKGKFLVVKSKYSYTTVIIVSIASAFLTFLYFQTWSDIKYAIKKKASTNKSNLFKTGGGPCTAKKLTEYEERILALLGKSFFEGVGVPECGVKQVIVSKQ